MCNTCTFTVTFGAGRSFTDGPRLISNTYRSKARSHNLKLELTGFQIKSYSKGVDLLLNCIPTKLMGFFFSLKPMGSNFEFI